MIEIGCLPSLFARDTEPWAYIEGVLKTTESWKKFHHKNSDFTGAEKTDSSFLHQYFMGRLNTLEKNFLPATNAPTWKIEILNNCDSVDSALDAIERYHLMNSQDDAKKQMDMEQILHHFHDLCAWGQNCEHHFDIVKACLLGKRGSNTAITTTTTEAPPAVVVEQDKWASLFTEYVNKPIKITGNNDQYAVVVASKYGNLAVLERIASICSKRKSDVHLREVEYGVNNCEALKEAIKHRHFDVARWLVHKYAAMSDITGTSVSSTNMFSALEIIQMDIDQLSFAQENELIEGDVLKEAIEFWSLQVELSSTNRKHILKALEYPKLRYAKLFKQKSTEGDNSGSKKSSEWDLFKRIGDFGSNRDRQGELFLHLVYNDIPFTMNDIKFTDKEEANRPLSKHYPLHYLLVLAKEKNTEPGPKEKNTEQSGKEKLTEQNRRAIELLKYVIGFLNETFSSNTHYPYANYHDVYELARSEPTDKNSDYNCTPLEYAIKFQLEAVVEAMYDMPEPFRRKVIKDRDALSRQVTYERIIPLWRCSKLPTEKQNVEKSEGAFEWEGKKPLFVALQYYMDYLQKSPQDKAGAAVQSPAANIIGTLLTKGRKYERTLTIADKPTTENEITVKGKDKECTISKYIDLIGLYEQQDGQNGLMLLLLLAKDVVRYWLDDDDDADVNGDTGVMKLLEQSPWKTHESLDAARVGVILSRRRHWRNGGKESEVICEDVRLIHVAALLDMYDVYDWIIDLDDTFREETVDFFDKDCSICTYSQSRCVSCQENKLTFTPLHFAAYFDSITVAEKIVHAKACKEATGEADSATKKSDKHTKYSALNVAVWFGNYRVFDLIHSDPDYKDEIRNERCFREALIGLHRFKLQAMVMNEANHDEKEIEKTEELGSNYAKIVNKCNEKDPLLKAFGIVYFLYESSFFVLFLALLVAFVFSFNGYAEQTETVRSDYLSVQTITDVFKANDALTNIDSMSSYSTWFSTVFIPLVFANATASLNVETSNISEVFVRVGVVRMIQKLFVKTTCPTSVVLPDSFECLKADNTMYDYDTTEFSPSTRLAYPIHPGRNNHVWDIRNASHAQDILPQLDLPTNAIVLAFTLYAPHVDLFFSVKIMEEFTLAGGAFSSLTVLPVRAEATSNYQLLRILVLTAAGILLFGEISELIPLGYEIWRKLHHL
eukprot:PhF_6_TR44299/c0_g1_i3/m.68317